MSIGNEVYEVIDFLRLPRPQGLPAGRQGSEEPSSRKAGRAQRSQNQFNPIGAGVNKLIFKLCLKN
jgi:hypothetical protein